MGFACALSQNSYSEYANLIHGVGPVLAGLIVSQSCIFYGVARPKDPFAYRDTLLLLSRVVTLLGGVLLFTNRSHFPFVAHPRSASTLFSNLPRLEFILRRAVDVPNKADAVEDTSKVDDRNTFREADTETVSRQTKDENSNDDSMFAISESEYEDSEENSYNDAELSYTSDEASLEDGNEQSNADEPRSDNDREPATTVQEKRTGPSAPSRRIDENKELDKFRGPAGTVFVDVLSSSLGVETNTGIMIKLLHRHSVIPTSRSLVFTTTQVGQSKAIIKVYEGDHKYASMNMLIGRFELTGLINQEFSQIEVTFEVNRHGVLRVSAQEYLPGARRSEKRHFVVKKLGVLSNKRLKEIMHNSVDRRRTTGNPRRSLSGKKVEELVRLAGAGIRFSIRKPRSMNFKQNMDRSSHHDEMDGSGTTTFDAAARESSKSTNSATFSGFEIENSGPQLLYSSEDEDAKINSLRQKLLLLMQPIDRSIGEILKGFRNLGLIPQYILIFGAGSLLALDLIENLWKATSAQVFPGKLSHLHFIGKHNVLLGFAFLIMRFLQRNANDMFALELYRSELITIAALSLPFFGFILFNDLEPKDSVKRRTIAALYAGLIFEYVIPSLFRITYLRNREHIISALNLPLFKARLAGIHKYWISPLICHRFDRKQL